ncbi:MAG: riboflavin synthase [Gemmatimonadales bacterium]
MFTGIVSEVGRILSVERSDDRLSFRVGTTLSDLALGESIAVSGACLTVVDRGARWFRVDAVVTTRSRTRFDRFGEGDAVNLERALPVGERLGGHLVQGHVDAVGTVQAIAKDRDTVLLDVVVPRDVAEITVLHGSITLDGVSLTVNAIPAPGTVQVALIPYTVEHTTLGMLRVGDEVHVEGDMIGKFVRQLVRNREA